MSLHPSEEGRSTALCWDGRHDDGGRILASPSEGHPRRRVVGEAVATLAFGCVLIALGLVGTSGARYLEELPSRWIFALPLAASCVLLLAKRSHPGTAAALGSVVFAVDVAIGGSIGVIVAYFDLVYCVAVWGRRAVLRRAEVLVGATVAVSGTACFIVTGDLTATALALIVTFTLFATPLWWGRSVRSQTELARMAAARAEDLRQLAELREEEMLRGERSRMADDLHDALAGNLAAIGIHAEAALGRPGSGVDPGLTAIREASVAASDELRIMVRLLRAGQDQRTSPRASPRSAGYSRSPVTTVSTSRSASPRPGRRCRQPSTTRGTGSSRRL